MLHFIKKYCFFFFYTIPFLSLGQESTNKQHEDLKYREDQFYIGINYNIITAVPKGVKLHGVSGGVQIGYLRDMPFNTKRTLAIAIGAGLTLDQYGQNLKIDKNASGVTTFTVLDSDIDFNSNKFSIGTVEVPLEIRWRNSSPSNYKFLRIHTGLRVGYSFWHKSNFKTSSYSISQKNIAEFEKIRLGATLSVGYSTFNAFAYYSILPFFNDSAITNLGQRVDFSTLKVGLIFYVL
ncbi:MAG: porin family protein [Flavobacteriales bacterium]